VRFPRVPIATSRANIEPAAFAARSVAAVVLPVLAAVAVLAMATGCGPRRPAVVPASGVVTLDGEPLAGGFVRLVPVASRVATGEIGPDGRFTLGTFAAADGCVLGTHGVEVIGPLPAGGEKASAAPAPAVTVPDRYRAAETSGLTVTVTGPTSDLVIPLTK
jgi:hypothetical protein